MGLSLGVSLAPYKICDFDCLYCQLGKTGIKTQERKEYVRTSDIIAELESWLSNNAKEAQDLSYITISGAGEPTLNTQIGDVIGEIRRITAIPVAVITNASLFSDLEVQQALKGADLVVPSLDAVSPRVFAAIDRPSPEIKIEQVISGLVSFRKVFPGKIWLEIMLVSGVNDDLRHIKKLKDVADLINPDKIQLNSPVRTTAEKEVFPVEKKKLEKIKEIFGEKCEII